MLRLCWSYNLKRSPLLQYIQLWYKNFHCTNVTIWQNGQHCPGGVIRSWRFGHTSEAHRTIEQSGLPSRHTGQHCPGGLYSIWPLIHIGKIHRTIEQSTGLSGWHMGQHWPAGVTDFWPSGHSRKAHWTARQFGLTGPFPAVISAPLIVCMCVLIQMNKNNWKIKLCIRQQKLLIISPSWTK